MLYQQGAVIGANGTGVVARQTQDTYVRGSAQPTAATVYAPRVPVTSTLHIWPLGPARVLRSNIFLGDFYYRIWCIPDSLTVLNAKVGTGALFAVWNAYPYPNILQKVTTTGSQNTSVDLTAPSQFYELEVREVNLKITGADEPDLQVTYRFDFRDGFADFAFTATLSSDIIVFPEKPLSEILEWSTNVLTKYDGGEQRIALRAVPRRYIESTFSILDDNTRDYWCRQLFRKLGRPFNIPMPQYTAFLTKQALPGDIAIHFDPRLTDLRVGDQAYLFQGDGATGTIVEVASLLIDGVQLKAPLTDTFDIGVSVAPVVPMAFGESTQHEIATVTDKLQARAMITAVQPDFVRPGTLPTMVRTNNLIVLDKRPLGALALSQTLYSGYNAIDNLMAMPDRETAWSRSYATYNAEFHVPRIDDPDILDWWRVFLYEVRGRQSAFLMPQWSWTVPVADAPIAGTPDLVLKGGTYRDVYFDSPGMRYLWIKTDKGYIARHILDASINSDSNTVVQTDSPWGDALLLAIYPMSVNRLGSDSVTIDHEDHHSTISLVLKGVDA